MAVWPIMNVGKIARFFGYSARDVKNAIEWVKQTKAGAAPLSATQTYMLIRKGMCSRKLRMVAPLRILSGTFLISWRDRGTWEFG
jgi:hypothetical protein